MITLSQEDRDTLNGAEQILLKAVADGGVFMISLHSGWDSCTLTYFTPDHIQHTHVDDWDDDTLAGRISKALAIKADEAGRADEIKAERIAKLKAELSALTEQQAA